MVFFWRRRWDSNPRAVARKLISSQPRYDHFDTSPFMAILNLRFAFLYLIHGAAPLCPVAVPKILCSLFASQNFDRCHSLGSLVSAPGGGRLAPHFDTSPFMAILNLRFAFLYLTHEPAPLCPVAVPKILCSLSASITLHAELLYQVVPGKSSRHWFCCSKTVCASPSARMAADRSACSRVLPLVPTSTRMEPGVTC